MEEDIKRWVTDGAIGLFSGLIAASYIASYTAAGIISMGLAAALLIFVFVLALGATFLLHHLHKFSWRQRAAIAILLSIVLGLTGWYQWTHYSAPPTAEEIAEAVSKAIRTPKETDRSATVLLDCQIFLHPIRVQPFADVTYMTMIDPFEGGGGPIGVSSAKADKDGLFVLDPNRPKSFNYRCQVTNFENYPIFSIYMNFKIQAEKTIKTESGTKSGEVVSTRDWPIGFNYINPKSTITFYILGFNQKLYVIAWLPQYAQYLRGGDDAKLVTKLRPPSSTGLSFTPREFLYPN